MPIGNTLRRGGGEEFQSPCWGPHKEGRGTPEARPQFEPIPKHNISFVIRLSISWSDRACAAAHVTESCGQPPRSLKAYRGPRLLLCTGTIWPCCPTSSLCIVDPRRDLQLLAITFAVTVNATGAVYVTVTFRDIITVRISDHATGHLNRRCRESE